MGDHGVVSSDERSQYGGAKGAADGGSHGGKAAASYSGVVAQRALYGSYKRRAGMRVAGKSPPPSRLSKASAADINGS